MKLKWCLPLFLLVIVLAGCGDSTSNTTQSKTNHKESTAIYTVTDDRGIDVTFEHIPKTVISLQPSNTEILFELGVGDQVIGVTDYDNYPEEAKNIERVSNSVAVNVERVVELNPDVVFAYSNTGDQVEQLEAAGLKVFVIQSAYSIEEIYGNIAQIAQVMGVEEKGKEVVENLKEQLASVQEKTASIKEKKKVYFEIAPSPNIWSIGSGTFQQELMDIAGIQNIYADQKEWFSISEEDVINRNPEIIITTVYYTEDPAGEIMLRKGWNSITAVQNGAVYKLNADLLDRPGPRIAEAAELMARTIYPELFEDIVAN